jgi:hypothetical protein
VTEDPAREWRMGSSFTAWKRAGKTESKCGHPHFRTAKSLSLGSGWAAKEHPDVRYSRDETSSFAIRRIDEREDDIERPRPAPALGDRPPLESGHFGEGILVQRLVERA